MLRRGRKVRNRREGRGLRRVGKEKEENGYRQEGSKGGGKGEA